MFMVMVVVCFLQDLFWSGVFWEFCDNEIFLSFLVLERAFYLIRSWFWESDSASFGFSLFCFVSTNYGVQITGIF